MSIIWCKLLILASSYCSHHGDEDDEDNFFANPKHLLLRGASKFFLFNCKFLKDMSALHGFDSTNQRVHSIRTLPESNPLWNGTKLLHFFEFYVFDKNRIGGCCTDVMEGSSFEASLRWCQKTCSFSPHWW